MWRALLSQYLICMFMKIFFHAPTFRTAADLTTLICVVYNAWSKMDALNNTRGSALNNTTGSIVLSRFTVSLLTAQNGEEDLVLPHKRMSKRRRRTERGVRSVVKKLLQTRKGRKKLLQMRKGRRLIGSSVRHIRGGRVMQSTRKMNRVSTCSI